MKKTLIFLLVFLLVLGLTSAAGARTDGEFTGFFEGDEEGYVKAVVTIEDDDITAVELREYDHLAREKGEHYEYQSFQKAIRELPEKFIAANDYDIDIISGATKTSEKAREAVKMSLEKSQGVTEFDGTFMARSDKTERGWGVIWLTLKGGEITDIRLEEVSGDEFKDENYGWEAYHSAREKIAERMLEANSYEVDAYTSATGSSKLWMEAAEQALNMAGFNQINEE